MVHNLRMVHMSNRSVDDFEKEYGYDWAIEMNEIFKAKLLSGDHHSLINYEKLNARERWRFLLPIIIIPCCTPWVCRQKKMFQSSLMTNY